MARKSLRRLQYESENMLDSGLADEEITRYGKQMMVGVGVTGQRSIREARVLVAGVGAAGSSLLVQLSAAGVGELGIIDPSEITETNPAKEPIFAGVKPGGKKVEAAKDTITDLNPLVTVNVYPVTLQELDHAQVLPKYSILVCCTDSAESRYQMSDLAVTYKKPLVMACALQTEGHCLVLNHEGGPCYRCLFPEPPKKFRSNQSDVGIFPGLKGVIGSMTAAEVLKMILGRRGLRQEVIVYEAVQGTITKHRMRGKRADCLACSGSSLSAFDYSQMTKTPGRPHAELLAAVPEANKIDPAVYFKVRLTQEWEGKPHFILDVRVAIQFSIYHFPNAVNVPLYQLSNYVVIAMQSDVAAVAETQPVFVICRRGIAATEASHILLKGGIKSRRHSDFFIIVGGLNACARANPKVPFY